MKELCQQVQAVRGLFVCFYASFPASTQCYVNFMVCFQRSCSPELKLLSCPDISRIPLAKFPVSASFWPNCPVSTFHCTLWPGSLDTCLCILHIRSPCHCTLVQKGNVDRLAVTGDRWQEAGDRWTSWPGLRWRAPWWHNSTALLLEAQTNILTESQRPSVSVCCCHCDCHGPRSWP